MKNTQRSSLTLRLPKELKEWLTEKAKENYTSQNDEIIRCLKEQQKNEKAGSPLTA